MPEKGFVVLLDALRHLAHEGLRDRLRLIATRDPQGYRGEYMKLVREDAVLSRMVQFIDPVPNIGPLLKQMDVLVFPSLWEACPILPMEAMVLGIPVVGTNALGLREVLRGTPSFVPDAGDPNALAQAIVQSISSSSKATAQAFVPAARKRFDIQRSVTELKAIYRSISLGSATCR